MNDATTELMTMWLLKYLSNYEKRHEREMKAKEYSSTLEGIGVDLTGLGVAFTGLGVDLTGLGVDFKGLGVDTGAGFTGEIWANNANLIYIFPMFDFQNI